MVLLAASLASTHSAQSASDCGDVTSDGFSRCWYAGAGVGLSHLDPEGEVNGWSTDSSTSAGASLHLGQQFHPHWFWEFSYLDAGEAALANIYPTIDQLISDAAVDYTVPSLMLGYTLWDNGVGLNLYAKGGVSAIRTAANDTRIGLDQQTATQFTLGAGARYGFKTQPWALSLDVSSFDRDAMHVGLRLSRSFGGGNDNRSGTSATRPAPQTASVASALRSEGACDNGKDCTISIDERVLFQLDQHSLSEAAKRVLQNVVVQLRAVPDAHVEVRGHTDSIGNASYNQALSEKRSQVVLDYLVSAGLRPSRLTARGYGEEEPIATNETPQGREQNRRVDFELVN